MVAWSKTKLVTILNHLAILAIVNYIHIRITYATLL